MDTKKHNHEIKSSPFREIIATRPFRHPGDWYLTMVLARVGPKSESGEDLREWVTWYFNHESGGYSEGHYFHPVHDYDSNFVRCEAEARADFEARCKRYC